MEVVMADLKLFDFENNPDFHSGANNDNVHYDSLEEKYNAGVSRVVTEIGSYKVNLLKSIFSDSGGYNLEPDYQRRITWNKKKRSKLIESLLMNIPIPPIYLYEVDYNKYEIMDGLQRVTAIIDFYKDAYALSGLEEWPELNGKKYSKLDKSIREGIDRRQLSVITLLKETALDTNQAERIKRLVFERLNTGGVKLTGQEIRNAIIDGPGNNLCKQLSELPLFRQLWEMPTESFYEDSASDRDELEEEFELYEDKKQMRKLASHALYKRMGDVEIVLRFFAMRQINYFVGSLVSFLDDNLKVLNGYSDDQLEKLNELFKSTLEKGSYLFGNNVFKLYKDGEWTSPLRMIYDPMTLALSNTEISFDHKSSCEDRVAELKCFYEENISAFAGKLQTKDDILKRYGLLVTFISRYAA